MGVDGSYLNRRNSGQLLGNRDGMSIGHDH